jgi:hypothetical protein
VEGFMVGTLEEAKELMALARAGKVVGRIMLANA